MTQHSSEPVPPGGYQPHNRYNPPTPPGPSASAPAAPANPFEGITARDYFVDAASALLLVVSLFMTWTVGYGTGQHHTAASHIPVLLVTIVSLLSLGLTYLWRAGAFGPTWNYRKMQDLRLIANAPYAVLVLVYLVIVVAKDGSLREAAAFGLAGAILAAQPRKAELGTKSETISRAHRWTYVLWGIAGLSALMAFIQLLKSLIGPASYFDGWGIVASIAGGALSPYLMIVMAKQINSGRHAYKLVAIGFGLTGMFLAFVALAGGPQASASFNGIYINFSVFLWMSFGAAALSPTLDPLMRPTTPSEKWRQAHHAVLTLTIVIAAVAVVFSTVGLIGYRDYYSGTTTALFVMTLIFSVLLLAGAIVVKQAFSGNVTQGFMLSSIYAGVVFVLFLILVIMASSVAEGVGWMSGLLLLISFVIPVALMILLWAPATSRAEYASLKGAPGSNTGFSFEGEPRPATAPPVAPNSTVEEPSSKQLWVEASTPGTAASRLHELALDHPHTHPALIANPSTYEGLRVWLRQVQNAAAASPSETTSTEAFDDVPSSVEVAVGQAPAAADGVESTDIAEEPSEDLPASDPEDTVDSGPTASAPAVDPLVAEAGNPATSGTRLQELAGTHPHLHSAILANPAAYDGLRTWIQAQQLAQTTETDVDPLEAEASDPGTSGTRLQELAGTYPRLHAKVAANRSAYPQLLEWLAQVDSPGVAEALRQR